MHKIDIRDVINLSSENRSLYNTIFSEWRGCIMWFTLDFFNFSQHVIYENFLLKSHKQSVKLIPKYFKFFGAYMKCSFKISFHFLTTCSCRNTDFCMLILYVQTLPKVLINCNDVSVDISLFISFLFL